MSSSAYRIGFDHAAQIASGYFLQDDPTADDDAIGAVYRISLTKFASSDLYYAMSSTKLPDRFGLLDDSEDRWDKFAKYIQGLNDAAPEGTHYKMFFLVRHGQGYRASHFLLPKSCELTSVLVDNVAEAKYGTTVAWPSSQCIVRWQADRDLPIIFAGLG